MQGHASIHGRGPMASSLGLMAVRGADGAERTPCRPPVLSVMLCVVRVSHSTSVALCKGGAGGG